MRSAFLLVVLTAVLVLPASGRSAATGKPWLWQCTQIHNLEPQYRCYVRLLREDIEASRNPARELPRIDRRVLAVGGPVEAGCHVLMHQVGREFARDHRVTLASLQRYVPRSRSRRIRSTRSRFVQSCKGRTPRPACVAFPIRRWRESRPGSCG